jgi:beta-lactamase regulating signal transducer with metallopeptidase domain
MDSASFLMLDRWAQAWLAYAWPLVVSSTLVIGIVWAASRLARRASAAWRYALWMLVLLRLALPPQPILPLHLGDLAVPVRHAAPAASVPPASPAAPTNSIPLDRAGSFSSEPSKTAPARLVQAPNSNVVVKTGIPLPSVGSAGPAPTGSRTAPSVPVVLLLVWLAGVVFLGALNAWRLARLHEDLSHAVLVASGPLHDLFVECLARQRVPAWRKCRLCFSDALAGPFVVGVLRPIVVLPRDLAKTLDKSELEPLLLHELAHVRRWDTAVIWLQIALQILHWPNPLVWLANRRIRIEREQACDDCALASTQFGRKDYGSGLIKVMDVAGRQAALYPGLLGTAEAGGGMRLRLQRIMNHRRRVVSRLSLASYPLLALLGALSLSVVPVGAQTQSTQVKTQKARDSFDAKPLSIQISQRSSQTVPTSSRRVRKVRDVERVTSGALSKAPITSREKGTSMSLPLRFVARETPARSTTLPSSGLASSNAKPSVVPTSSLTLAPVQTAQRSQNITVDGQSTGARTEAIASEEGNLTAEPAVQPSSSAEPERNMAVDESGATVPANGTSMTTSDAKKDVFEAVEESEAAASEDGTSMTTSTAEEGACEIEENQTEPEAKTENETEMTKNAKISVSKDGGFQQVQTEERAFHPGKTLVLENSVGSIVVSAWDKPTALVRATRRMQIQSGAPTWLGGRGRVFATEEEAKEYFSKLQVKIREEESRLTVRTSVPPNKKHVNLSVNYEIRLPKQACLDLKGGIGNIRVVGIEGNVKAHTSIGQVHLSEITGDTEAQSDTGQIECRGIRGNLKARSSIGQIVAAQVSGNTEIRTDTGQTECRELQGNLSARSSIGQIVAAGIGGNVEVKTDTGAITCRGFAGGLAAHSSIGSIRAERRTRPKPGERIECGTSSGSVEISLPEGSSFDLRADTNLGRIHCDFPVTMRGEIGKHVSGRIGNGGAAVELKTDIGAITLRSAAGTAEAHETKEAAKEYGDQEKSEAE